jgi:uncharacterized protein YecE (DUF72 family)
MQCHIGCSGFYNKDWKKVFYPEKLPQSKWFEYYCTRFNTLELNTTFYRFPTIQLLQKWYDKSPAGFKFSVKAPRLITHYKQFNETKGLLNDFYSAIRDGLKEKLGPVLFQLPAKIIYNEKFLQQIVQNIDISLNNVVEFRDVSWWNNVVFETLSTNNTSFCGVSHPKLPDEIIVNTHLVYYRFHGIPKLYFSQYSRERIEQFSEEMIKKAEGKTAYIFFNNTATMAAINNAEGLKDLLKDQQKTH